MMKPLSFKITSDHLLLCVFLSLLWGFTDARTIMELTSGTKYDFSLFTVFENVRSSGVNINAVTAPRTTEEFKSAGQNETSITLQWKKVNDILNYIILFSGYEINVTSSEGEEHVTHTISYLTSGTKYDVSLFTVFENVRSSGVNITAVTAPRDAQEFKSVGQTETSITLQWNKVDYILNYIILFNGYEINIAASEGQDQVTQTILELTSGTKYDFSLFTVFENVRSSGKHITAVTAPRTTEEFKSAGQNETSITLQWKKVNDILNYIILFSGYEINVTASEGEEHVTHTISYLTSGTKYDVSLFTVFENVRSSGVNITAVTAPRNTQEFKSVGQNETSITLQWKKVDYILNYIILFNGYEINVAASAGQDQVTQTILELTSGTKYDFSLFTVFENVRSSGVNITAVTAPRNTEEFKSAGQNETSITLQWKKVDYILNYVILFNGSEINVTASEGEEHITHTISNLTRGTKYNVSLFTVFENLRSSGLNYNATTARVISLLLVSECLSQAGIRVSCSSEGGDSPQYSWTLDGHTLKDAQLLSGHNESSSITLKQNVSGQLVCSVRDNISRIPTCGFISTDCTLPNGMHISQRALVSSNTLCIELTANKTMNIEIKDFTEDHSLLICGVRAAVVILLLVGITVYYVWKKKKYQIVEGSAGP